MLTGWTGSHILADVSPQAFSPESLLDVVHGTVYTYVPNERYIVVFLLDLLLHGPWYQHLFMTILHSIEDPLGGFPQVLPFELSLRLRQQMENVLVS